jgi:hypothetical protein
MPDSSVILGNLRWGILRCLGGATLLSGYVVVLSLVRGSTQFDQYGMSTWGIVASYFAAGLLAGTALGLLRSVTRYALGAVATGILCGTCVYGAVGYAMDGTLDLGAALFLGTLVGGIVGFITWRRNRKSTA